VPDVETESIVAGPQTKIGEVTVAVECRKERNIRAREAGSGQAAEGIPGRPSQQFAANDAATVAESADDAARKQEDDMAMMLR